MSSQRLMADKRLRVAASMGDWIRALDLEMNLEFKAFVDSMLYCSLRWLLITCADPENEAPFVINLHDEGLGVEREVQSERERRNELTL